MAKLVMKEWNSGFLVISMTHLCREYQGWGLKEAKQQVERFLGGEKLELEFPDAATAAAFRQEAEKLFVVFESPPRQLSTLPSSPRLLPQDRKGDSHLHLPCPREGITLQIVCRSVDDA